MVNVDQVQPIEFSMAAFCGHPLPEQSWMKRLRLRLSLIWALIRQPL